MVGVQFFSSFAEAVESGTEHGATCPVGKIDRWKRTIGGNVDRAALHRLIANLPRDEAAQFIALACASVGGADLVESVEPHTRRLDDLVAKRGDRATDVIEVDVRDNHDIDDQASLRLGCRKPPETIVESTAQATVDQQTMMPGTTIPFDQQAIAASGREGGDGNATCHLVDVVSARSTQSAHGRLCHDGLDMHFFPLLQLSEGALEMCPTVVRISNEVEEIAEVTDDRLTRRPGRPTGECSFIAGDHVVGGSYTRRLVVSSDQAGQGPIARIGARPEVPGLHTTLVNAARRHAWPKCRASRNY